MNQASAQQNAALKTELQTDPAALGLAALVAKGQDADCARLLNIVGGSTVAAAPLTGAKILRALDPTEFSLLPADSVARLNFIILMSGTVDVADAATWAVINKLIGVTMPITAAALQAQKTQLATRAEVLFGRGTVLTDVDVAKALRG